MEGRFPDDNDDNCDEYIPTKRYSYSREHKLAAIDYFQTTWRDLEDGTHERLSKRYASRKLKITRKMLRNWICNKERIMNQKKRLFSATPFRTVLEERTRTEGGDRPLHRLTPNFVWEPGECTR